MPSSTRRAMVVVAVTAFASLVPAPSPRLTLATSRRSRSTSFAAEAGRSWEECPSRGDPTRLTRLFLQPKAFGVDLRRTLGARLKTLAVAAASRNELRGKRTTGTPGVLGSRGLLCRGVRTSVASGDSYRPRRSTRRERNMLPRSASPSITNNCSASGRDSPRDSNAGTAADRCATPRCSHRHRHRAMPTR